MVGLVFLIKMVFDLLNLDQYLKSYELIKLKTLFCFYCCRPAHRSAQAGMQAGPVEEQAGRRTGPNRVLGRTQARGCRPSSRPRPGWRPGLYQSQPACWPVQADAQAGAR